MRDLRVGLRLLIAGLMVRLCPFSDGVPNVATLGDIEAAAGLKCRQACESVTQLQSFQCAIC